MIRLLEVALFLAPFALFAAWRLLLPRAELSPRVLAVLAAVLLVVFAALVWFRQEDAEPAGAAYAPAELRDGRIVTPESGR
jgi:hypothetical protein